MSGASICPIKAIHLMLADEAPPRSRLQMQAFGTRRDSSSRSSPGALGLHQEFGGLGWPKQLLETTWRKLADQKRSRKHPANCTITTQGARVAGW